MPQENPVQRRITSEGRTAHVSGEMGTGAMALGGAIVVALLGVLLVAFGAIPAIALLIAAVPLALAATKFIKSGRPRGAT